VEQAILKTLIYADLFDYPLTRAELWRRLIWEKQLAPSKRDFEATLKRLEKNSKVLKRIEQGREYYFLPGREAMVKRRRRREGEARRKLEKAGRIVKFLRLCPWVWLIGVSGSVAAGNARPGDDIDLFVVTAPRRLWLTRLWLVLTLELLGQRRRPQARQIKNKFCLNLLISADQLAYFSQERNLFLAHELRQLQVLFHRHNTYYQLLWVNRWVKQFLPNWPPRSWPAKYFSSPLPRGLVWDWGERLAYWFQRQWMARRRTRERVEPFLAAFHPRDLSRLVLTRFSRRCRHFQL